MSVRHAVWLVRYRSAGAESFAVLFALESLTRAVLATVIPLQALAVLGDSQRVSLLFFAVGLAGLAAGFTVPWWIRLMRRRWVYSGGAVLLAAAAVTMAGGGLGGQVAGMVLRVVGTVAVAICLNLYIMDHIDRRALTRSEPLRLFYAAGAWSIGPAFGVYLGHAAAPWAPFAFSAVCAAALLAYFWFLRASEALPPPRRDVRPPDPLRYVRRYVAQPRLVLAWTVSLGRNAWWVMFFIYVPIYAVESGLGEVAGGLVVSAGASILFLMPAFGWAIRRFGLRRVFVAGFAAAGAATLAAAAAVGTPPAAVVLMLVAAFAMSLLDAGGNVLFLRAVRPRERPEMTTVYASYRDIAEIGPPGLFALLLRDAGLALVFAVSGAVTLGLAGLARAINRRL